MFTFSAVERRSETSRRSDNRRLRPQRRVQPRGGYRPQRRHTPQAVPGQRQRHHRVLRRKTKNSGKGILKLNCLRIQIESHTFANVVLHE